MKPAQVVEGIWARDPSVWTGSGEGKWLGWLDEPWRMAEDVDLLLQFADSVVDRVDAVVLLGMGGSSLAPEVLRRAFGAVGPDGKPWTTPTGVRNTAMTVYRIPMLSEGFKGRPK